MLNGVAISRFFMVLVVIAIGLFYKWRLDRRANKIRETIDAFDLVNAYKRSYSKAYLSEEKGVSRQDFETAALKSEEAFRIQMGAYLRQYFSNKQMSMAINRRKADDFYDGEDILSGMMTMAKKKSAENIKQVIATLNPYGVKDLDESASTRRRRRR